MISFFLRLKHWQYFILFFLIPMGLHVFNMTQIFLRFFAQPERFDFPLGSFYLSTGLTFISMFGLLGWMWSVYHGLRPKFPEGIRFPNRRIRFFFILPVAYISCLMIYSLAASNLVFGEVSNPNPFYILSAVAVILPLHLLSMFGMFHSLYWVARTIKTAELQRSVDFSDFVGEFFLIWFFPIGVWIVQPNVNRLYQNPAPEKAESIADDWERRPH